MTRHSIAALVLFLLLTAPAHAYLLGPSCNDGATLKALIAEAECSLLNCRLAPFSRPASQIKSLSAKDIDSIMLAQQKANAVREGGELPAAVVQYGAFVRGFAVDRYVHISKLNLAVSHVTEISHFKSSLTCSAELSFNVNEAREALYNAIAVKVYSQRDNAAMLIGALDDGDTNAVEQAKVENRATWLGQIDKKLKSPRTITFVVSSGPAGLIVSTPKALLMD